MQAPDAKPTWCSCGSKQDMTCEIRLAGKPVIVACASCAERAPFHAHITRITKKAQSPAANPSFNNRFTAKRSKQQQRDEEVQDED